VSSANRDPSIDVNAVFARHGFELLASQPEQAPSARHFRPMEGKTYQLGRMTLAFKRTEGDDEGSYSLIESVELPGAGAGRHRHPSMQETFLVLEGRFDFEAAGERRSLGAGEMLVIPRGAVHGFACTSEQPGRLLTISNPARVFEAGVAELCASQVDSGTPQGGAAREMRAIAARHGLEFL
jgi:quercetin dioxygenase-like cupin family protein